MRFMESITRSISHASTDIGSVLLKMGIIDSDQLQQAVLKQRSQENANAMLGEVLVAMGAISRDQLDDALAKQRLMRRGKATEVMAEIVEARLPQVQNHVMMHAHAHRSK